MSRGIQVAVNSHLWVPSKRLPKGVEMEIQDALMLDNLEKEEALRQEIVGAEDMEDYIELFEYEGDYLVLPRGFASQLSDGMAAFEREVHWQDERCRKRLFESDTVIPARPYQQRIIDAVLNMEQGIVSAPTAAGKTVAALEIIRLLGGNAIVIVNTKEIADQWMQRVKDWLGEDYPTSLIGDGNFEICDGLTVAIQATLWSRREELRRENFFRRFATMILDECHHATADTFRYIVNLFHAAVRVGFSATPKKTGDFRLAESVLGPIIVEITEKEVEANILKPEIQVIETRFGRKQGAMDTGWLRRKQYSTVLKHLVQDGPRNKLIATEVVENHFENANLILSKRIGHLSEIWEALVAAGYPSERIFTIVGADKRHERREVIDATEQAKCVVLSTLADEALDAPRLDRLHLIFPTRNTDLIQQQIGRIRRRHPDKTEAIVIDYRDMQVQQMESQYMDRRHKLYNVKGWNVVKRKDRK